MEKFKRKTSTLFAILPLMFLLYSKAACAAHYYVSIKGSDRGNGTRSSPWRSVNKALASVPPNRGDTIHIGPGTFNLGDKVSVPSGINIVGSGISSTTIIGKIQMKGVNNLSISGMKFNGKNHQYQWGILIRDASQLRLHDLAFNAYSDEAIGMERVSNGKIYNITITDSSYNNRIEGGGGKQTSAFTIANLTNVDLHDIKIDTRARGGAGMTSSSDAWSPDKPWESPPSVLKNVRFYNLDIKVDQWNAWSNGWTPQMALELWHSTCHDCEIYNSTFNSTLSLVTEHSTRIHVHHNLWYGPNNPFYACELNSDNTEFDHNYIRGGTYPLAMFDKEGIRNNLNVHHNIFENTKQGGALVGHFLGKMNNFKFINNTVYINLANRLFYFEKGEVPNQQIRNNIFYSSIGNIGNLLGASVGVDNNLFFNIHPVGSHAITSDPKLSRTGSLPSQYYMPKSDSLPVNLGAIQAGNLPWYVGSNTGEGQNN